MEIIDYLRIMRKRLAVLILVPIIAAVAALALVFVSPVTYTSTATVSGNTLVGGTSQFTGPQGTAQYVAAFTATAQGPALINRVSDSTGVARNQLRDNLVVNQRGASSDMTLAFTSTKRDDVEKVVTAMTSETLMALFEPREVQATEEIKIAQETVEASNTALGDYSKEVGLADPVQAYQVRLNQVSSLEQQQANLKANGNSVGAAAIDGPLKTARESLAKIAPILTTYNNLLSVQKAAVEDLIVAQGEYRHAAGQLRAATADNVVFVSGSAQNSRVSQATATVLPVFAAGIFMAIVLVFVLEMLSGVRKSASDSRTESEIASETDPDTEPNTEPDTEPDTEPTGETEAQAGEREHTGAAAVGLPGTNGSSVRASADSEDEPAHVDADDKVRLP